MAAKKINYWKWGILAAIVLAAFFGGCQYERARTMKSTGIDTTVRRDSFIIRYKPVPYKVVDMDTQWLPGRKVIIHDTLPGVYEVRIDPVDTANILRTFYQSVYYDSVFKLKRGTLSFKGKVHQNRLDSLAFETFNTDTVIHQVTVKEPPKKFVLSYNISGIGNTGNPLYGVGGGLGFKMPDDTRFDFNVFAIPEHRPMVQMTYSRPISINLLPKLKK